MRNFKIACSKNPELKTALNLVHKAEIQQEKSIRPIYYFADNQFCFEYKLNKYINVPHAYLVKSFAEAILKGKAIFKILNCSDREGLEPAKYLSKTLDKILKKTNKQNIKGVNISLDVPVDKKHLKKVNFNNPNYENIVDVYTKENSFANANDIMNKIKTMDKCAKLAEKGIFVSISGGNYKQYFNLFSLSRLFTKKPENIIVAGAINEKGHKFKSFYNNKKLITTWEHGIGRFLPVLDEKYKQILGLTLEGSHSISIRPKHFSNYYEIHTSNLFSGLTLKEASEKVVELNKQNNNSYQIIKNNHGYTIKFKYEEKTPLKQKPEVDEDYDIKEHNLSLQFMFDESDKSVSKIFQELKKTKPKSIIGSSFSAPVALIEHEK